MLYLAEEAVRPCVAAVMYARESWFVLSSTFTLSSASPRNKALWNRDIASPLSRGDREKRREGSESGEVRRRGRREGMG